MSDVCRLLQICTFMFHPQMNHEAAITLQIGNWIHYSIKVWKIIFIMSFRFSNSRCRKLRLSSGELRIGPRSPVSSSPETEYSSCSPVPPVNSWPAGKGPSSHWKEWDQWITDCNSWLSCNKGYKRCWTCIHPVIRTFRLKLQLLKVCLSLTI